MQPDDRHAVLADPTRRALLAALRGAPGARSVRDLAVELGLHANSVREQLARLAAAGLVRVTRAEPAGRGRPGLRYEAASEPEDPYRVLAGVLADEVAAGPDPAPVWEAAGVRWGRRAAGTVAATGAVAATGTPTGAATGAAPFGPGAAGDDAAALAAVVDLLAQAGFAPEPAGTTDTELRLRACPFLPFDGRHLSAVCGVHLGFLRGAFRELGSSRDAVAIEPFVEPDLCVARLGRMPRA
jgi:predicted ArsR family transcriptional regulator